MSKNKSPLLLVIHREAERIQRNPAYRFMLFTGPLIGIALLWLIFHQGVVKKIPIAVVNKDQSALSIKIENYLNAASELSIELRVSDLFQAKAAMERAEVEAVIVIPEETEKAILAGESSPIPIYINGSNVLKAGLIQRAALTSIKTISGGIQLKKLMATGLTEKQAMDRIMPVKVNTHVLFNPYMNYNYFLNSAMLYIMLYLFVFLSSIYTLGIELKRGTGHELLMASNNSVRMAVLGKLFPYTVIFSGFAMLISIILFRIEGMPIHGNYLLIFGGQFVTIVTYQLMGLIFVGATINLRLALSLGSAYSMMSITFCGLTFPFGGMPLVAQWFSAVFPFTWWEKIMISQSLYGAPIGNTLKYICYILIFQVISLAFLPTYKRYLSHKKYWGKA